VAFVNPGPVAEQLENVAAVVTLSRAESCQDLELKPASTFERLELQEPSAYAGIAMAERTMLLKLIARTVLFLSPSLFMIDPFRAAPPKLRSAAEKENPLIFTVERVVHFCKRVIW